MWSCRCGYTVRHVALGFEADVDIQRAIQLVRAQRSGMVQTEVNLFFKYVISVMSPLLATVQVCVQINTVSH